MNGSRILTLGLAVVLLVGGLIASCSVVEDVDAKQIVVIQSPVKGDLKIVTEPGWTYQGMGTVTTYPRRAQIEFKCDGKRDDKGICPPGYADTSIQVRFNDGGHASVEGILSWEMPLVPESVVRLHKEFGSVEAIDKQLVGPALTKAFYLTSPLMSSTESYASRRTEFLQLFEDQLRNGVYKTRTVAVKEPDPITGVEKTVNKVELVMDDNGTPVRAEASSFGLYKITALPPTITTVVYDSEVEGQIKKQRDNALDVQLAIANTKKAEQDAITAKAQGEARAATAKADQEVIKVGEVTQAEKVRDVAKLSAEAAGFTKQRDILLGEGMAEQKRLLMNADGALQQKLDAYVKINNTWAAAISQHQGPLVPNVVMGGSSGSPSTATGSMQQMMEMLSLQAAKNLSLDMSLPTARR